MASNKYNPALYRVFLSRNFIDVMWLDVKADSMLKAKNKAQAAANKLRPAAQSRAKATDNGWIPDEPITVERAGSYASGTHSMEEVDSGVFLPSNDVHTVVRLQPKAKRQRQSGGSSLSGMGGLR